MPIAAPAYWFLELLTDLQEWAFTDLPNGLAPRMGAAASSPGSASAASAGKRWMLLSLEHPDLDGDSYPSRPAGTPPPQLSGFVLAGHALRLPQRGPRWAANYRQPLVSSGQQR
ncbi:MAG TPA: hypothetical protein VG673_18475 [Actinomycetota bacterium]|nr:hypothetical protein [Actinomycetota bacterium]